jgi:hypothetical protein
MVVVMAELDLTQASYRCNCSICRRNRFWAAIAKPDGFKLVSGEAELTKYLFGSGKGQHFFCKHCGVRVFGLGPDMAGINIGCLEGVTEDQLSRIPVTCVDGMNDRWNERPEFWQHI